MKATQAITTVATLVGTLISASSSVQAHGSAGHFHADISRRYVPPPQYKARTPSAVGSVDPAMYIKRREAGTLPGHFRKRASNPHGTTEASAAELDNEAEECAGYYVEAVNDLLPHFPSIWDVATIVSGDDEATSAWKEIQSSGLIPSGISPHGTQPASLLGTGLDTGYDINSDPDCWWTGTRCDTPKHNGLLPDVTVCPEPHTYGYTHDDGPNCTHNALYDFWQKHNQKATVLYIGSNIMDWPLEAQRGIADGHHLCVHTWSHRYMTALTDEEAFAELWYTSKAMKSVMGITPTCWRPPFGDVDDRIRAIAQGIGLRTILWSDDTFDWNLAPYGDVSPSQLSATYSAIKAKATTTGQTGGIIVLEHEINEPVMNFTMSEYDSVTAAWKYLVPLSACLNLTQPYGEKEYVYPDFADYIAGTTMPQGLPTSSIAISSAQFTAQGTLSGQAGNMQTATAGGPDNSGAASLSSTSVSGASSGSASGTKASAAAASSSKGTTDNTASTSGAQTSSMSMGLAWTAVVSFGALVAGAMLL